MKGLAGIDDLLDDLTQLINLNRKNTAIFSAVVEFADRVFERAINGFHAVTEQVLKANNERKGETTGARFINNFKKRNGAAAFLKRLGHDIPISIDGKIAGPPTVDVVGGVGRLQVPIIFRHLVRGCNADNY